jgi:hypothetical protein
MSPSPPNWTSILALLVSAFSLGWNFYRDIVLKPRLRTHIGIMNFFGDGRLGEPRLIVAATNLGPGSITCTNLLIRYGSFLQ